jgi:hypothetical protein
LTKPFRRGVLFSRTLWSAAVVLAIACPVFARPQAAPAQATPEIVGRLAGDDVAVKNAISFETENGRSTAIVAAGSDITVRSGQAKIDLLEGGDIEVCGPAHFSVLKSPGALTLALDYGVVHLQIGAALAVTIYTPLIVATPVAIGNEARDITIGLDRQGVLCAISAAGAVRLEQQLTGQRVLVPQGGQVDVRGGELQAIRNTASANCSCDVLVSQNTARKEVELSVPDRSSGKSPNDPQLAPTMPPPADRPIYRIDVPLTFDARSPPALPAPDPAAILLVRESQPAPEAIFRGLVEPAAAEPPQPVQQAAPEPPRETQPKKRGFVSRLLRIFHRRKPA